MDTITTILNYGNDKNCMLVLVDQYLSKNRRPVVNGDGGVVVYEADLMTGLKAYFSVLGKEVELSSGDTVSLNGWYANKLGLIDGEPLPLRRIKSPVAKARSVHVEPLSSDDWEILERNAGRVELVLLDQVRVVWHGQILPVWIQRSICVYMKITSTEPAASCVILEKNTEVVVAPKLRVNAPPSSLSLPSKFQYRTMSSPSRTQSEELTNSSEFDNTDILEPRPSFPSHNRSPRSSVKRGVGASRPSNFASKSSTFLPLARRQSSLMESVMKFIFPNSLLGEKKEVMDNMSDSSDKGSFIDFSLKNLPPRNGVLRVQPMTLNCKLEECFSVNKAKLNRQILSNSIFGYRSHITQPFLKESGEATKYFSAPLEVFQPSTVYADAEFVKNERFIHPYLPHLPNSFIARLQRLPSPEEKARAAQKSARRAKSGSTGPVADPSQKDTLDGLDNVPSILGAGDQAYNGSCYVRVVAIDRKAGLTDKGWEKAADQVLSNQPLLYGHVIIPDLLRRQLHLETTSSIWLHTGPIDLVIPHRIHMYILSSLPKTIGNDLVIMGFTNYIRQCANEEHPLVAFQGIFLKFIIFTEQYVEVQLTFFGENEPGNVKAVTMLSELNIDHVQIVIERNMWEDKLGVVNKLLPYCSTSDFDAKPSTQKLKHLGGVDSLVQQALLCLHASLASRPLSRHSFEVRGGLSHGVLLITGPRGSGKSSLVHGLCRKMAHLPVLAYIVMVDCKTLRGKAVSTIQKNLELVFDEAAWREPAIIVLENLDIIVPAPSNPESEITGEALYSAKIAQVLEGLIRYEIQNNSRVTVIATSTSRSSLHPNLISSRGMHCIQQTLNIGIPDKDAREKILLSILQKHNNITFETVKTLDIASIVMKTESFVARDLELLVNRTLHARMSKHRDEFLSNFTLTNDDFDETLSSFKPVSIRNVPLHKAGELGWTDVGGLISVKTVLMETLKWPTKYPQLFSTCPLRLRSGIMLYGAPGTGKTLLAGVVAKECGLNFISVKGPELLNKYIGASEQTIRDLFTKAQSAKPCILFFDEFDSIAPKRGHDNTGVTDRVVNQLLTQLDGVEGLQGVYVLAATSRPDLIDPALLRPGRLDVCLNCSMPDENERYDILVALTNKMSLASDVDLKEVAIECKNFTGADLKALLYNAQLNVIHENTDNDRSMNESVVWIKGDSSQPGTTLRRASVVKEGGALKLSLSKSVSVNSLGEKSCGDVHSPKWTCRSAGGHQSSGNSSGNKTPRSPHLKYNESDVIDLVQRRRGKGDMATENIFKFPDQGEIVTENKYNLIMKDSVKVEDETSSCTVSNGTSSTTLAEDSYSSHLLPSVYSETQDDSVDGLCMEDIKVASDFCDFGLALNHLPESTHACVDVAEAEKTSTEHTAVAQESDTQYQNEVTAVLEHTDTTTNAASENGDSLQTLHPNRPKYQRKRHTNRMSARGSQKNLIMSNAGMSQVTDIRSPSMDRPVTVFTSLETGLATLSAEDMTRYLSMVKEIQRRDESLFEAANSKRRTSLQLESRMSVLMEVNQRHLIEAAKSMRPSVSATEREKYIKIYEHFVSSRKYGFDKIQETVVEKRATLA